MKTKAELQDEVTKLKANLERKWEALHLLLDNVDYVAGNCSATEMVGAVLPKVIIEIARKAAEEKYEPN